MRALAVVLAGSLIASGCAANSFRIPPSELERLTGVPPEARGERVRVIQEVVASEVPAAPPVTRETQVVIVPQVGVSVGVGGPRHGGGFGGLRGPGGKIGGAGSDGKAAAVAATALVTAAVIEGSRFDGWARLHPMHPVHLLGKDGGYTVVPLAWLDPDAVAWTETAVVRPTEGPWLELDRAPLSRQGLAYGVYGGAASLRSIDGDTATGPAWTVQLGYFPIEPFGVLASVFFGWRTTQRGVTLLDTHYTAEVQFLPVQLGILHAGPYVGLGTAYSFEDRTREDGGSGNLAFGGNDAAFAMTGGAMLQLDVHTRVALTARLGVADAHGDTTRELLLGVSVY
jgi:hypothetical protein